MWKNNSELPVKNGDYPAVMHPTFHRDLPDWDKVTFRETARYSDGLWYSISNRSLESMQWELIAWYDVPEYKAE